MTVLTTSSHSLAFCPLSAGSGVLGPLLCPPVTLAEGERKGPITQGQFSLPAAHPLHRPVGPLLMACIYGDLGHCAWMPELASADDSSVPPSPPPSTDPPGLRLSPKTEQSGSEEIHHLCPGSFIRLHPSVQQYLSPVFPSLIMALRAGNTVVRKNSAGSLPVLT